MLFRLFFIVFWLRTGAVATVIPTKLPSKNPTRTPSASPSVAPSTSPSHLPTAPPTSPSVSPTLSPTRDCPERSSNYTDVVDMISKAPVTTNWMEGGYANMDDGSWTRVTTILTTFVNASVFVSLPDIGSNGVSGGFPAIARIRNVVSNGQVSFDARIYQANDSYCSKEWYVPVSLSSPLSMSWLVAENGAYNLSQSIAFIIGRGAITRQDSSTTNTNNFIRFIYPMGCVSSTLPCGFSSESPAGLILQLQTLVYDRLLIPRVVNSALRFFRAVLQPHDSLDSSYYVMLTPETMSYMAFTSGVSIGCVEGLAFDTNTFNSVTSTELSITFGHTYTLPPGIYGVIGSGTSLSDSTGLNVFKRTTTSASVITQEDQCVDQETDHTTPEVVHVLVVGKSAALSSSCLVCKLVFTPQVSVSPSRAPTLQSSVPTTNPTRLPSRSPSSTPSTTPSTSPTRSPSSVPSFLPSRIPTRVPSASPTVSPSVLPSSTPTKIPSLSPTSVLVGSSSPSLVPSHGPSLSPSRFPSNSPSMFPSQSPSISPSLSPSLAPSNQPSSMPSTLPSFSPTCDPSRSPSRIPSLAPSTSPSHLPTAPPTSPSVSPTLSPTRDCPERSSNYTDVVDMISKAPVTTNWMEGGYANMDDGSWTRVTTILTTFVNASVFVSLPDIGSNGVSGGFPAIARIRNVVSNGQVSFDARIYQANDSYCSKEWYVPVSLSSPLSMSWLVAENGAYNLSQSIAFIIGRGAITRQDSSTTNTNNFIRFIYPMGCVSSTLPCGFSSESPAGLILQLQTLVYDRLLIPRVVNSALRFFRAVLQPHDSLDSSYYVMLTPETMSYMAFTSGVSIGCVEGLAFDTNTFNSVTSTELSITFGHTYTLPPGIYGVIGSGTSLSDSTGLNVFKRTTTSASVITQEDQCVDQETDHTTPEVVHVLVVGKSAALSSSCLVCKLVFTPQVSVSPSRAPTLQSSVPTTNPTRLPSRSPSSTPSTTPSTSPTRSPSSVPSFLPSRIPTRVPSASPTVSPSVLPSSTPTKIPSLSPTSVLVGSSSPSLVPSHGPSLSPSRFPSNSPSMFPSQSPSISPSLSPSLAPSNQPSSMPSTLPSFSPTCDPSRSPSRIPSLAPSTSPSHLPTAPPTSPSVSPTLSPTRDCPERSSNYTDVVDMISKAPVTTNWMEGGYANMDDGSWTRVTTILTTFVNASVFVSLPDIGSNGVSGGFPAIARIRNVVSNGQVSFDARIYQANDSYCSKEWYVPVSLSSPLSMSWLVAENGAYNLSQSIAFIIGRGAITRQDSSTTNTNNFIRFIYPMGCVSSTLPCGFSSESPAGLILQLQTLVYDRLLIPRVVNSALRFFRAVLQPHDSLDSSYYVMLTPETMSYMAFTSGVSIGCVEGLAFDTNTFNSVTSTELSITFGHTYTLPPGIYGVIGSGTSLSDSTGLNVFKRTTTSASVITQEDQCVDQETDHTTPEVVHVLVVGKSAALSSSCLVCKLVFTPQVSVSPSRAPTLQSSVPTTNPTRLPSRSPSSTPSTTPSTSPTRSPSSVPSFLPSRIPTRVPSASPTVSPSVLPSSTPTKIPSLSPTSVLVGSSSPSLVPSHGPSLSPSRFPSNSPSMFPSQSPSISPSLSPSLAPSNQPSSMPSTLPSFSPTCDPSRSPSRIPSLAPSTSPSHLPTAPPTSPSVSPTLSPTRDCPERSSNYTDVVDMISKAPVTTNWMEGGYANMDDGSWTRVTTILTTFVNASVFVSLPDIGSNGVSGGFPAIARIRNVVSNGQVSFDARIYQANDSYCSKEWYVPVSLSSPLSMSWLVAENGAYNLSQSIAFIIGRGAITRQDSSTTNTNNFIRFIYPMGCVSSTLPCGFSSESPAGLILQLQTLVYDRLLIPRVVNSALRFFRAVLQPHDSLDSSYYVMLTPETMSYMAFTSGVSIGCVEGLAFDTNTFNSVTSTELSITFGHTYTLPPGIYGVIGSGTSLSDSTGLNVFKRTTTSASVITQEDQCVDQETDHTTPEVVHVLVVGKSAALSSSCLVCKLVFTPQVSVSPSRAPTLQSSVPTTNPTRLPSRSPSSTPSTTPSTSPTRSPSSVPSFLPSRIPTRVPSASPTVSPSVLPSSTPTKIPSLSPTSVLVGSSSPSLVPSHGPSLSPSRFPSNSPSMFPSQSPSISPSLSPSLAPSNQPSSMPSTLPSFSPTCDPSRSPSRIPSVAPSTSPSHLPTAPPTSPSVSPTLSPTRDCPERSSNYTDVVDMISKAPVTTNWMEGGYANMDDGSWTRVTTILTTFVNASVFVSLPDIGSNGVSGGFPAIARIRNVVSNGQVSFDARIYQANDSYCSKEWYVPVSLSSPLSMSWLVAENGAYNLSQSIAFIIGRGAITRQDSSTTNTNNFIRFIYPMGCVSSTLPCGFSSESPAGLILQLQTLVYDRLLIPRVVNSALRFFRAVLQPHDSLDSSYYVMLTPETMSYMAFTSGVSIGCVEGLAFDTNTFNSVTSTELSITFGHTYTLPPGIYGVIGSGTSLSDSTGLNVFKRTTTSASVITQEDQCVDQETDHTTPEVVHVLVVGKSAALSSSCLVCKLVFTPQVSVSPSRAPTLQSSVPTTNPTRLPSRSPTSTPSTTPSTSPTRSPSSVPSFLPSRIPTRVPSASPTVSPSVLPSSTPTKIHLSRPQASLLAHHPHRLFHLMVHLSLPRDSLRILLPCFLPKVPRSLHLYLLLLLPRINPHPCPPPFHLFLQLVTRADLQVGFQVWLLQLLRLIYQLHHLPLLPFLRP